MNQNGIMVARADERLLEGIIDMAPILLFTLVPMFGFYLAIVYSIFNWIILQTHRGQTVGKVVMKHKVITVNGTTLSLELMILRYFAFIFSGLVIGVGLAMIGWSDKRQGLHDRICGTIVVRL